MFGFCQPLHLQLSPAALQLGLCYALPTLECTNYYLIIPRRRHPRGPGRQQPDETCEPSGLGSSFQVEWAVRRVMARLTVASVGLVCQRRRCISGVVGDAPQAATA